MSLGEKIAMLRKQNKLSQAELAQRIEVSRDAIGKYERNDILPTIEKARKIARVLSVSLDFLVSEDEQQELLDKEVTERIKELQKLPDLEKDRIFSVIDAFIRDTKTRKAYGI